MRIVLTIHHALDPNAGAPGTTLDLAAAYERAGHSVEVISHDDMPGRLSGKWRDALFPEFAAAAVIRERKRDRVDVVDASTGDAWIYAALSRRIASRRPLVVTRSHGLEHVAHFERLREADAGRLELSWRYPLYYGGFKLWEAAESLRRADLSFFLNSFDREYAVRELRVPASRARIVHNAISDFFLGQRAPESGDSGSDLSIVQVGSYIARKGVAYSAPALGRFLRRHPDASVTYLGTSCRPDRVYADFSPDVHDRVHVRSRYGRDELPALLRKHQVVVFPSLSEGFGKTLLECMACGLSPIATNTPGPTEFVIDGDNGLLVQARDSFALERALERLNEDRELLGRLRVRAHATAQSFSWDALADERLQMYRAGLEDRSTSAMG